MNFMYGKYLPTHHLDGIILSARWNYEDISSLKQSISTLKQYAGRVIVYGPIATYDQALPRILARSLYLQNPGFVERHRVPWQVEIDRAFSKELSSQLEYISVYKTLCGEGACIAWADDATPLQFDDGHLTAAGSALLACRVASQLFPEVTARTIHSTCSSAQPSRDGDTRASL